METEMAKRILKQRLEALNTMSKAELLRYWPEVFDGPAPAVDVRILRQQLAWRIQALARGGLSPDTQQLLAELKQALDKQGTIKDKKIVMPPAGTRLSRDYNGERHEVLVLSQGFEYRGQLYRSLSKIANVITGNHWSGPLFFGLRRSL